MFNQLKAYLKRYPSVVALYETVINRKNKAMDELSDIRDLYFSKPGEPVDTPHGFKLRGSRSVHHLGMQKGTFEEEETALIRQHLDQSDIFVDVGANIGFYTCLARSLGKHVIAIEPLSNNLNNIYGTLIDNNWKDVEVFPVGLSEHPGLAVLYGASNTGASLISNWAGASNRFRRVIPISTLDILLGDRFDGKKLFIKIDVEGFEYPVLMGALKTIKMTPRPTWIIEICLNEFHPSGLNPNYAATFEMFWQQGYEVRMANKEFTLITPGDIKNWVDRKYSIANKFNYLFIPK